MWLLFARNSKLSLGEKRHGDMAFTKKHWLFASVAIILLSASLGAFLAWRANRPVETKTVYALPERNSEPVAIQDSTRESGPEIPDLPSTASEPRDFANSEIPPISASDQIAADLRQKKIALQSWSADFLEQFPDVPAATALVDAYQDLSDRVIDYNDQLQEKGYPEKARIRLLIAFVERIILDIEKRTNSGALHNQLMRENPKLKIAIDRYTHANEMLPIPLYLFREGVNPHGHEHE